VPVNLNEIWPYALLLVEVLIALTASNHAVLHKEDTRSAIAWVGLIWLVPIGGALLYLVFGVNRIQRRARALRWDRFRRGPHASGGEVHPDQLHDELGEEGYHLRSLIKLLNKVTQQPLLHGNQVTPLVNGSDMFAAMLDAIASAKRSVTLSTYIFDNDRVGQLFLAALKDAMERGVEVRVIIDDVGARYTWPSIAKQLRRAGIPCVTFLPTMIPWTFHYSNLRTHRKIMVVDGVLGFTGGANIREGHCFPLMPRHPVSDIHFRVTGPVVTQLQEVFVDDWAFCTGEVLEGEPWFMPNPPDGPVLARGVAAGPDDHYESLHLALLGAIASARQSILICTPYFVPEATIITALIVADMRGAQVEIVVPEVNNLPVVKWASMPLLRQLIDKGCRVWLAQGPFDHSKMLVIDGVLSFVGSSNWDTRSMRLNFEFNLECYDRDLAQTLTAIIQHKKDTGRRLELAEIDARTLPIKLRDGIARLLSPYL
jgi:cardiolipin synthase